VKPYYQDDAVQIYHGDCREILPGLEPVDLVLTDPPYGLGDLWQGGKEAWPLHHGQMSWDAKIVDELPELITIGRQQIVWGGHLYPLPKSRGWFIWDKINCNDKWTSGQAEMAWSNLDRPIRVWRSHSPPPAVLAAKSHPTQKPVELMSWCLKFTDGQTILDPFMGSGTTLRAAKDLGRKAIGIEIEEKYCEIAAKRMAQEVLSFSAK
jgi:site-specific DNA-methyltransferase (adenine-specific)